MLSRASSEHWGSCPGVANGGADPGFGNSLAEDHWHAKRAGARRFDTDADVVWQALTTPAPAASCPTRAMLSALTMGAGIGARRARRSRLGVKQTASGLRSPPHSG